MLRNLQPEERVLVLGASGWFGRTFLTMLPKATPVLKVASTQGHSFIEWSESALVEFAPTVVVNFAFLTRDRLPAYGPDRYRAINEMLIQRLVYAGSLPSVRLVLDASSGAVTAYPTSLYGQLKAREEEAAMQLSSSGRCVVVARAYSLSGGYVAKPRQYAFSDFVIQALSGCVKVSATQPTFRRFVSVRDFLTVSMGLLLRGWTGTLESGGPLIELRDLAARVTELVNPSASIVTPPVSSGEMSIYASDNLSWIKGCTDLRYHPLGLDKQILETYEIFRRRGLA